MKKKRLALFLALCMILSWGALVACENNQPPPVIIEKHAPEGPGGTIRLAFWDAGQKECMRELVKDYQNNFNANKEAKIELELVEDDYWGFLDTCTVDTMPDVFCLDADRFPWFAAKGILLDCGGLYERSNFPDIMTDSLWSGGKLLGVPKDFDTIALAYNKTVFDEAGISPPADSWDWDKLVEVAQTLTRGEMWGFVADAQQDRCGYLNPIYQAGGFTVKEGADGEWLVGYSHEKTMEAIQWWVGLQRTCEVSPPQEDLAGTSALSYFKAGKAAMIYLSSRDIKECDEAMKRLGQEWDIAVMPKGPGGERATMMERISFAAYNQSENPELVKDLLKYLGTEQAAQVQSAAGVAAPAFSGTHTAWDNLFQNKLNVKAYVDMLGHGVSVSFGENTDQWQELEREAMQEIISQKTPDVLEVLTQLQGEVDALLRP